MEVNASEIVSFSATSGTGPAEVTLTAGANPYTEERTAKIIVRSGSQTKTVSITQEAGGQVVTIPEFDYLVLRYSWSDEDGTDFDTATGFVNTGLSGVDGYYVGWSRNWTTTSQSVGDYLQYGGDNMQSGLECALINMAALNSASGLNNESTFQAEIYGNWYGSRLNGYVTVSFTAYLGGTMEKDGFNFVNSGGDEVYTGSVTTNVAANGTDNYTNITGLYSHIGTMVYDRETRDCVIVIDN